ncbi:hypothetical protein Glove_326g175 [Diversispora epigaea]|uniref:Uncharacterized protein n=1 Tax=Diversispora epigaea TaxID=1348612 RepID=A0A397HSU6_9GLOM|nr:hypothetical protein Glove_326g175 [Diversispora epigaea]
MKTKNGKITNNKNIKNTNDNINNDNNNNNKPSYTITDLLTKISSLIDTCDYELALKFANRALSMDENNVQVLEILGTIEIELGMFDEARENLSKAISINPNQGYSKYLYMGQLSNGLEAINYFQSGVNLMISEYKSHLNNNNNNNSINNNNNNNNNDINNTNIIISQQEENLNYKISTALCSMVEIYLTDCCFESNAELKCEEYLNQALEIDSNNSEVYQILASVRISQQRNNEAKSALLKSLDIWSHLEPGNPLVPSYDSRISLVKLLLELSLYTQALSVLEILQKENDQIVDLWYLYGWCYYCMSQDNQDGQQDELLQNNNIIIGDDDDDNNNNECLAHLEDARDCLITCQKLYQQLNNNSDNDENDILRHSQELLLSINSLLRNDHEDYDDDDGGDADEWEDFGDDDDDSNQMEIM